MKRTMKRVLITVGLMGLLGFTVYQTDLFICINWFGERYCVDVWSPAPCPPPSQPTLPKEINRPWGPV